MKLDPDQLRAEADAHRERMESPMWAEDPTEPADGGWLARVVTGPTETPSRVRFEDLGPDEAPLGEGPAAPAILSRLDAIQDAVTELTEVVQQHTDQPPPGAYGGESPGWLLAAAGNPQTYDAPDPARTSVCVRVLPTTYARLQRAQVRLGLRTTAGAWECILRLGLAAAERLPVRS